MLDWLNSLRRERTLKRQLRQLGSLLAQRYSKSEFYTPSQILKTLEILNVDDSYYYKGYAMFLDEAEYKNTVDISQLSLDYHGIRKEILATCFKGEQNFNTQKIFSSATGIGVTEGSVMPGTHGCLGGHGESD